MVGYLKLYWKLILKMLSLEIVENNKLNLKLVIYFNNFEFVSLFLKLFNWFNLCTLYVIQYHIIRLTVPRA